MAVQTSPVGMLKKLLSLSEEEAIRQIPNIASSVKTIKLPDCKALISHIKALIKHPSAEAYTRLMALRVHHACMM